MKNPHFLFRPLMKRKYIYPFFFLIVVLIVGSALIISNGHGATADETVSFLETSADKIPNFAKTPTISSVQSGSWSDPASWSGARIPTGSDIVKISLSTTITINDTSAEAKVIGIGSGGTLRFNNAVNTRLTVGTVLEYEGGSLEIGTQEDPIKPSVKAELIIADQAIDPVNDPRQYGTGLIALGKVRIYGDMRTSAYIQLAKEPKAQTNTISLATAPSDWKIGDTIVLPDTRQVTYLSDAVYKPQWEEATIAAFSVDRKTVTLAAPLAYDHLGAYDGNKALVLLPHVGVLTRNIVIRSANPVGTRGHMFMTQSADVDIRYAQFTDLGRTTGSTIDSTTFNPDGTVNHYGTNQIGRYAMHFHHVYGPQEGRGAGIANTQFQFIGNTVKDATKWGIAIHNSHYGKVNGNVVYKIKGAGITTEDGSETANEIDGNFVVAVSGTGQNPDVTGPNTTPTPNAGAEGSCLWLRSTNNKITNNVLTNCRRSGLMYWSAAYSVSVPKFPGAKTYIPDQVELFSKFTHFNVSNNTSYGAESRAVEFWDFDHAQGNSLEDTRLVVRNTTFWNISFIGVQGGGFNNPMMWDGVRGYNDPNQIKPVDVTTGGLIGGGGYTHGARASWDNIVNFIFENFSIGVAVEHGTFSKEYQQRFLNKGKLRNYVNINIVDQDHYRNGETAFVFNNIASEAPANAILRTVYWSIIDSVPARDQFSPRTVLLQNYQNIPGNDYQIFHGQQNRNARVPGITEMGLTAEKMAAPEFISRTIPEVGLTNEQVWAKYNRALFGRVAPCSTQNPEATGGSVVPSFVNRTPPSVINEAYTCAYKTRTLSGTVKDGNGIGVAGAKISLYTPMFPYDGELALSDINKHAFPIGSQHPVMTELGQNFSQKPYRPDVAVTTDANGNYQMTFRAVEGESVQITASKSGYKPHLQTIASLNEDRTVNFAIRAGGGDGLSAKYYSDQKFTQEVASQIEKEINIDWKTRPIKTGLNATAKAFSAKWTGEFQAPETGEYAFTVTPGEADGFASTTFARSEVDITVDGKVYTHTGHIDRLPVHLEAGKRYKIEVSYVDTGNLTSSLVMTTRNIFQQAIPQAYLYSSSTVVDGSGGSIADIIPPTAPTNLVATVKGSTSIALTWSASTDDTAVAGYRVLRNSAQVGSTVGTSFTDNNLSASTSYTYTIIAFDAAGNTSIASAPVSATTGALQTAPFTFTSGPTVDGKTKTATSAQISGTTSVAASWNIRYGTNKNNLTLSTTDSTLKISHTMSLTGLSTATTYYYRVVATDASGRTVSSDIASFKTSRR